MFGYRQKEVAGQDLLILVAPEIARELHDDVFWHSQVTGTDAVAGARPERVARRKDGHHFAVELSVSRVKIRSEWHAMRIIGDMSNRHRAVQSRSIREITSRPLISKLSEGVMAADVETTHTL